MPSIEARYCSNVTGELDIRHLVDGVFVFQQVSRTTHLLHPAAWKLFLEILRAGETGVNSEYLKSSGIEECGTYYPQLIAGIESVGLVRRC
jgi:hypothetical protein